MTFKGGDKYKGLLARIAAQNVGVKAGILAGATKADGTKVAYYAAVNEFGGTSVIEGHTVRIPPRPFMRDTVRGSSNALWCVCRLKSEKWIKRISTGKTDG